MKLKRLFLRIMPFDRIGRFKYLNVLHIIYVLHGLKMVSLTLSVSDELKREMEKFPEINWSVVARESIRKKIFLLKELNDMLAESKLTEEDTLILGKKVNKVASRRFSK